MTTKNKYLFATGVKADIERFLTKFSELETVRYEEFSMLWREKNMSFIFAGRENEMELREFTEDLLRIAAEFLQPPYSFQVQVGALYLLYGLYFKQPNNPRTRIRCTQTTWEHLQDFRQIVYEQKHMDVEFIYLKLLHTHAFEFVYSLIPVTPMVLGLANVEDEGSKEVQRQQHLKDIENSMLKDALNLDLLKSLHTNYQTMKIDLGPKGKKKPHTSLDVIQNNFTTELEETICRHENWRQKRISGKVVSEQPSQGHEDSDSDPDWLPEVGLSVGERRARLKERAFQSAPKQRARRRKLDDYGEVTSALDNIGRNRSERTQNSDDDIGYEDVQMPGPSHSASSLGPMPDMPDIEYNSSDESSEGATSRRRLESTRGRGKPLGRGKGRGKGRGRGKKTSV